MLHRVSEAVNMQENPRGFFDIQSSWGYEISAMNTDRFIISDCCSQPHFLEEDFLFSKSLCNVCNSRSNPQENSFLVIDELYNLHDDLSQILFETCGVSSLHFFPDAATLADVDHVTLTYEPNIPAWTCLTMEEKDDDEKQYTLPDGNSLWVGQCLMCKELLHRPILNARKDLYNQVHPSPPNIFPQAVQSPPEPKRKVKLSRSACVCVTKTAYEETG